MTAASDAAGDAGPAPFPGAGDLLAGLDHSAVASVPVASVRGDLVVRTTGTIDEHVAVLSEVPAELPPITVHRSSMRVLDGLHRLRVAQLRGDAEIRAVLVDCDEAEALALAIGLNAGHGLPLSQQDRRSAVRQLLGLRPDWSDRRIANVAGVSHHTVGTLRRRASGRTAQSNSSVGRDGRSRPRNPAAGRAQIAALLEKRPDASLREIARLVGMSPATVLDVRRRRTGPATASDRPNPVASPPRPGPAGIADPATRIAALRSDPTVRGAPGGRVLLRLLSAVATGLRSPEDLAAAVPAHSRTMIAILARESAVHWLRIAERLDTPHVGRR